MKSFITNNSKETQKLGEKLAQEIKGGEIIALKGDLGAGKTTFTQGLLKGLGAEGPYTSPTFLIMKEYKPHPRLPKPGTGGQANPLLRKEREANRIYHIDAYRVGVDDILDLGWEEIVSDSNSIVIIEWPERIEKIISADALWINFEWLGENKRKITFKNK